MAKPTRLPRGTNDEAARTSPTRLLQREVGALRRELRLSLRAYSARLEVQLAEIAAGLAATGEGRENNRRERLHILRELTGIARDRKLKPEKGRRKDLRKLEAIIAELHGQLHRDVRR